MHRSGITRSNSSPYEATKSQSVDCWSVESKCKFWILILSWRFRGAAGKGHLKVVFVFCELVPETIETVRWAVADAAKYEYLDVVKFLLLYNSHQYAQKSEIAKGTRNTPASQDDQGATTSASTDQDRLRNSFSPFYVFHHVICCTGSFPRIHQWK